MVTTITKSLNLTVNANFLYEDSQIQCLTDGLRSRGPAGHKISSLGFKQNMIFKAAENLPYFQKLGHLIVIVIIIVPDLELNMMKLVIFP